MTAAQLRDVDRIILTGCGTALPRRRWSANTHRSARAHPDRSRIRERVSLPQHADDERHARLRASARAAKRPTRSARLRESQRKGYRTLGICNNVASTIARESDGGVYMHAGPEIGVAATKSFTSQVTILTLIGLLLGRMRHLSTCEGTAHHRRARSAARQSRAHPRARATRSRRSPKNTRTRQAMMFLGRQFNYPVALEGALKMKEITYLFAEGHPERRAQAWHHRARSRPSCRASSSRPTTRVFEKNSDNIEEVQSAQRPDHRHRHRRQRQARQDRRRRHHHPALPRLPLARSSPSSRSNSSPITSPSSSAATSISRATSPRA